VDSFDAPTLKKMLIEHQLPSDLAGFIGECVAARLASVVRESK